ncbi:S8 family serine peptidase, partial [Candidatus Peregrinibacteria bacterium]|nr:S8 family serine peptidase [Candidatus Peregrinibacteria bacterium]
VCEETPDVCTSWTYSDWSICADDQQTRTVVTSSPDDCVDGDPVLTQVCEETPDVVECGTWSTCSAESEQSRTCQILEGDKAGMTLEETQDCDPVIPKIDSISPDVLIPGETVVTINGENFGDSYEDYNNQICFDESCILDYYIDDYLQSWSDTEIILKVPYFVTGPNGKIGLKLLNHDTGYYEYFYSESYGVMEAPIVEWYYSEMDQEGVYVFSGSGFGNVEGKVVINGSYAEIISWDDNDVEFKVPANASSGAMYIESADGVKSQEIQVSIIAAKKKYSNDEYSSLQWYLESLNVDKAWDITEGSEDVIVAVIDTGVDIDHEDLKHAIWTNEGEIPNNGEDDDDNGYVDDVHGWDFFLGSNSTLPRGSHGTGVASVIAAEKDNGIGMAGVAPGVTIMPLNAAVDELFISSDAAIYAIKYAVDNGADIINLSFGGIGGTSDYEDAIKYAYDNNVLVVAATGNEYLDFGDYSYDYSPVCTDLGNNAVIGVAAINGDFAKSAFSNYGDLCVDLVAPGENILIAIPSFSSIDLPYTFGDGTSFSSPLVAGIAALVKSKHPSWNVEEIKEVLLSTAESLDFLNLIFSNKLGSGIPNSYAALVASKPSVTYNYNPSTDLSIEETGGVIEIEVPETTPIEEPGPIENISEEKVIKDESSFSDVHGNKNEFAINYLKDVGIIDGYPDGTFKPGNSINRAELLKILVEGKGISPSTDSYKDCFNDVSDQWFAPYICYAEETGWVDGYPGGSFKPEQVVSKSEAVKMLLNSQGVDIPSTVGNPFQDVYEGDWFGPFVGKAKELGILEETGSLFSPAEGMKRAGICENLYRLLTY